MAPELILGAATVIAALVTGITYLINASFKYKLQKLEKHKERNDMAEIENNIVEKLLPLFEKKDVALDRIADVLDNQTTRLSLIETQIRNHNSILESVECSIREERLDLGRGENGKEDYKS